MMIPWLTIVTVSFAVLSSSVIADDPCRYQDPTKGVIDLTSLAHTDGSAAYPDKAPGTGSNYKYSYNPCRPFSEGTTCQNVAVCQVSMDGTLQFKLGTQESTRWSSGAGLGSTPSVSYSFNEKQVTVSLQCLTAGLTEGLEALGENPINNYKFTLTHKCACWDGCSASPITTTSNTPKGGGGGGIGGGAVFIIILLVLAFVYFVGFAAFYRFRLQRSGAELIPHRTFWVALPAYAKDGVVYVYRRAAGKGDTPYQSV